MNNQRKQAVRAAIKKEEQEADGEFEQQKAHGLRLDILGWEKAGLGGKGK